MLHKELGAFLIAVGQQMVSSNRPLDEIIGNIELDQARIAIMIANGVDGERAELIGKAQGYVALRNLSTYRTFESVEAQKIFVNEDNWDEDEDADEPEPSPFTIEEATEAVDIALADYFGAAAVARMKTYNLSIGELAGDPGEVEEFVDLLCESLDVRMMQPTDIENFKRDQLAQWLFFGQAASSDEE